MGSLNYLRFIWIRGLLAVLCIYVCGVGCVCTWVCACSLKGQRLAYSITVHLIPLIQGLSLKLELHWQPAILLSPPP